MNTFLNYLGSFVINLKSFILLEGDSMKVIDAITSNESEAAHIYLFLDIRV